jgi:hypothetical protein
MRRSIHRYSTQPGLLTNERDLVMLAVMGQVVHPVASMTPYQIGNDGIPRVLPRSGGIVLNHRVGDRCIGLMGDHIEPGVALQNNSRSLTGSRKGPNLALLTYTCVGNIARVISGPCIGRKGLVTGKHGGVDHVLVDFPTQVLRRLQIGDRIQIDSYGLGLELLDQPEITVSNCSPSLLQGMGIQTASNGLVVPVSHRIPARVMGSGLGKNTTWRGDYDIQLFDALTRRRFHLDTLRFGDIVAICDADTRYGPSFRTGFVSIGVIVHGDSVKSGHGPGVTVLLSGPARTIHLWHRPMANLAAIFGLRDVKPLQQHRPLTSSIRNYNATRFVGLPYKTKVKR